MLTSESSKFRGVHLAALVPATITMLLLTGASSCSSASGVNNQPASSSSSGATSAAASHAPVAHLSDPVVIAGNNNEQLTVQLVKIVDPTTSSDGFSSPNAGSRYVAVQFKLTNSGRVAYSDSPDNAAKALDASGQSFAPDFTDTAAGPSFAGNQVNLAPGATQLGFITFQVLTGDAIAKLQFTTDSGFGQTGEWLVP